MTAYRNNRLGETDVRTKTPTEPVESLGNFTRKFDSHDPSSNYVTIGDVDRGGAALRNHPLGEFTIYSDEGRFTSACSFDVKTNSVNSTRNNSPLVTVISKTGSDTSNVENAETAKAPGYGGHPKIKGAG